MKVAIYSIQSTLYEGEAEKLIAETPLGQMTVLENHVPLISRIDGPRIQIQERGGTAKEVAVSSGILEIRPGTEVVVLAEQSKM